MNLEQGTKLVKLARESVTLFFQHKKPTNNEFKEKLGLFVSIHTIAGDLRGCIGFPTPPEKSLSQAVPSAARLAAFEDSRFEPIKESELSGILFEVSILTKPQEVKKPFEKNIEIGKDGLIIDCDGFYGLLLPQVAKHFNWTPEQFLNAVCEKAGLLADTWKQDNCKISKFQAEVFREKTPNKEIIQE